MTVFMNICRSQDGAAAIQYAFVAAILGLAVLAGSLVLGGSLGDLYQYVGDRANAVLVGDDQN